MKILLQSKKVLKRTFAIIAYNGSVCIDCLCQSLTQSLTEQKRVTPLKFNTPPGLTPATCLFCQANVDGLLRMEFIDTIVQLSLENHATLTWNQKELGTMVSKWVFSALLITLLSGTESIFPMFSFGKGSPNISVQPEHVDNEDDGEVDHAAELESKIEQLEAQLQAQKLEQDEVEAKLRGLEERQFNETAIKYSRDQFVKRRVFRTWARDTRQSIRQSQIQRHQRELEEKQRAYFELEQQFQETMAREEIADPRVLESRIIIMHSDLSPQLPEQMHPEDLALRLAREYVLSCSKWTWIQTAKKNRFTQEERTQYFDEFREMKADSFYRGITQVYNVIVQQAKDFNDENKRIDYRLKRGDMSHAFDALSLVIGHVYSIILVKANILDRLKRMKASEFKGVRDPNYESLEDSVYGDVIREKRYLGKPGLAGITATARLYGTSALEYVVGGKKE